MVMFNLCYHQIHHSMHEVEPDGYFPKGYKMYKIFHHIPNPCVYMGGGGGGGSGVQPPPPPLLDPETFFFCLSERLVLYDVYPYSVSGKLTPKFWGWKKQSLPPPPPPQYKPGKSGSSAVHIDHVIAKIHLVASWGFGKFELLRGGSKIFISGGGVKDYVPSRTLRAQNRTHFRHGSRAHLRALEALGLFNALLCYLSVLFKHSDKKYWLKKHIVDPILVGEAVGRACCTPPPPPPLDPPLLQIKDNLKLFHIVEAQVKKDCWIFMSVLYDDVQMDD